MLKFEGKNRSYKISNLLGKEETLERNDKYLSIPIIVTNEFLRIYNLYNKPEGEIEGNLIEINKKDTAADLPYEIFFENQIKDYLEKVRIYIYNKK